MEALWLSRTEKLCKQTDPSRKAPTLSEAKGAIKPTGGRLDQSRWASDAKQSPPNTDVGGSYDLSAAVPGPASQPLLQRDVSSRVDSRPGMSWF